MTNPFDENEETTTNTPTPAEANEALHDQLQEDAEVDEAEDGDVEEDDEDLDVDTPELDEAEDEPQTPVAAGATAAKATKEPKAPARPPVAEGYVSPVRFAHLLTEHAEAEGWTNRKGKIDKDNPITSQMVYSYIKNNAGSKNPFPLETDTSKTGGRVGVVDPAKGIEWWTELRTRVVERQANAKAKAEKAAANAAKAAETPAAPVEAEAAPVEAE